MAKNVKQGEEGRPGVRLPSTLAREEVPEDLGEPPCRFFRIIWFSWQQLRLREVVQENAGETIETCQTWRSWEGRSWMAAQPRLSENCLLTRRRLRKRVGVEAIE